MVYGHCVCLDCMTKQARLLILSTITEWVLFEAPDKLEMEAVSGQKFKTAIANSSYKRAIGRNQCQCFLIFDHHEVSSLVSEPRPLKGRCCIVTRSFLA